MALYRIRQIGLDGHDLVAMIAGPGRPRPAVT